VLGAAWLFGVSRFLAELGAVAAIGAYVLAVGAQPSVVRAGVAGALGSLSWLTARGRDRWYFMLLGTPIVAPTFYPSFYPSDVTSPDLTGPRSAWNGGEGSG
jgi:hypothetical protein